MTPILTPPVGPETRQDPRNAVPSDPAQPQAGRTQLHTRVLMERSLEGDQQPPRPGRHLAQSAIPREGGGPHIPREAPRLRPGHH